MSVEDHPAQPGILDQYYRTHPDAQNIIDLFQGEWSSKIPEKYKLHTEPGLSDLFEDERIMWAHKQLGGFDKKHVLELGPLEGGHTYMLHQLGVREVTAVEANSRAFLKCLSIKEICGLNKARFLLGDCTEYLKTSHEVYDIILASGILYHVEQPLLLLHLMTEHTTRLFVWTHYYDETVINQDPSLQQQFKTPFEIEYHGKTYTACTHFYNEALDWDGYCGGSAPSSVWLTRDSIIDFLKNHHFTDIVIGDDIPTSPHGPAFSFCAIKDMD